MARKMKDSGIEWTGEIPEGWSKNKCLRLFNVIGSGTTPKSLVSDESPSINWIQSGDINGTLLFSCKNTISESTFSQYSALKTYSAPFIIIAMYGASIGNISISFIDGCVNQACCVLSVPLCNLDYAFYAIKSAQFYLVQKAVGGGQPNISQDTIKQLWIPQPSLAVQEAIANSLNKACSHIDAILTKTRTSIEEYKKLKQAVITQAVTKGVRGEREMKDSGVEWIGEIPKEWVIQKIKSISSRINVGVVIRPSEYFDENGTVPFLRGINVKEYLISSNNMVYINESSNHILSKSQVHTDDILIVRDGSIGTSCVVPAEYDGANVVSMVIVTPSISCDSRFTCYSLNSDVGKTQFTLTKIGSALTHTSVSAVSDIIVAVPSCTEQKEIAAYLDAKCAEIDGLIAKKEQLVKELESYKKSLIYEVVTGKREV